MSPTRVIGVDAGGTKLLAAVVDERLSIGRRFNRGWPSSATGDVLETMVEVVTEARATAPDALAVGFGIPSLLDFDAGVSLSSVHLQLDGVAFRELMRERLKLAVFLDNDANLALLAEQRHGAARGARHAVMLTLGTGIGGGLFLDGRIYRGSVGAAGELGHTTVDLDGPPCQGNCPNRGCLEVMASGRAMGREGERAAEAEPESELGRARAHGLAITGRLVTEQALAGDRAARGVLDLIGQRLGAGLVGIVNSFNPEVVVIGGGAAASGDLLLEPARRVVAERALRPSGDHVRIVAARFGEEAGMIGAAIFALEAGGA